MSREIQVIKYVPFSGELLVHYAGDEGFARFMQHQVASTAGGLITELLLAGKLDLDYPVRFKIQEATAGVARAEASIKYGFQRYDQGERCVEVHIRYWDKRPPEEVQNELNESRQRGLPQVARRPLGNGGPAQVGQFYPELER